jgi:hypothetical protein
MEARGARAGSADGLVSVVSEVGAAEGLVLMSASSSNPYLGSVWVTVATQKNKINEIIDTSAYFLYQGWSGV